MHNVPRFIVAGVVVLTLAGCANTSGDVSVNQVRALQGEAKKDVPKDLGTVPQEQALRDVGNPEAGGTLATMGKGTRGRK